MSTNTITALLFAGLALLNSPAAAQDLAFPREEAATLIVEHGEIPTLRAAIAARDEEIVALRRKADLQAELLDLERQKQNKQADLTALALQERDYWKGRLDTIEKEAAKKVKFARVQGYAATGAAIGTAVMPGAGTLGGLALGAAVGWFLPD